MQRSDEVLLGRLAVQKGLIAQEELDQALQTQVQSGGKPPMGELLVELGLISKMQLDALVAQQKTNLAAPSPASPAVTVGDNLLGRRAIEARLIKQEQLQEALRLQGLSQRTASPKRLGEVLVSLGLLTVEQTRALLAEQGKRLLACPQCKAQFNVHGAPPGAALKCRRCGAQLAEAPPSAGPQAGTPPLEKLKAEGSYYVDTPAPSAAPPTIPARPPARAAKAPRIPRAEKVEEDVEYLPYARRVQVSSTRKRWTLVSAVGLLVLVAVFLVRLSSTADKAKPAHTASSPEDEPTSGTPTPPVARAEPRTGVDEVKEFLAAHATDPLACYRHVQAAQGDATDRRQKEALDALLAGCAAQLKEASRSHFNERVSKAQAIEAQRKFKDALDALSDLPTDQDPIGAWKDEMAQMRDKILDDAVAAWKNIEAQADSLAKEGKLDEAVAAAEAGLGFGLPLVTQRAATLVDRLRALAEQARKDREAAAAKAEQEKRDHEAAALHERAFERVKKEYDQRAFGAAFAKAEKLLADKASSDTDREEAKVILEDLRKRGEQALAEAGDLLKSGKRDDARKAYQRIYDEFQGTTWAADAKKGVADCTPAAAPPAAAKSDDESKKKLEEFKTAIRARDPASRATAIGSLAQVWDPAATRLIAPYLTADTEEVRVAAAQALARPGDDVAILCLSSAIEANLKLPTVLKAIAKALGDCDSEKGLAALHQLFRYHHDDIAHEAIDAVAKIGDPLSVEPLIELLKKIDSEIESTRIGGGSAVQSLGASPPPPDKDLEALQTPVQNALGAITGRSRTDTKGREWSDWWKTNQGSLPLSQWLWCPATRKSFEVKPGASKTCPYDGDKVKNCGVFLKRKAVSK